jgi:carotenoid cleavage dioxygenase-like enzyme
MSVVVPFLKQYFSDFHDEMFGASTTAHPKIDPVNNRLISWTWRAKVGSSPLETNPQIEIHEWNQMMIEELPVTTHVFSSTTVAPHDFSISENYYVFIENRVKGNTIPYILGTKCPAECVNIIPHENMMLNIIKRPNKMSKAYSGTTVTIPLTPGFTIHSVCSWEEESKLSLITTAWDTQTVSAGKVVGGLLGSWKGQAPNFDNIPVTLLYRTLVDIESGQLLSHSPVVGMEKVIVEHPHINPNYESQKVRYLWMSIGSLEGISSPPLGYLKLDLETGKSQKWFAPIHHYCEELVVVPKSNNVGEDDVYLIATIFDANINKSRIAIFDGKDISAGPIVELQLSHHLPHSLHGCFTKSIIE